MSSLPSPVIVQACLVCQEQDLKGPLISCLYTVNQKAGEHSCQLGGICGCESRCVLTALSGQILCFQKCGISWCLLLYWSLWLTTSGNVVLKNMCGKDVRRSRRREWVEEKHVALHTVAMFHAFGFVTPHKVKSVRMAPGCWIFIIIPKVSMLAAVVFSCFISRCPRWHLNKVSGFL